VNEAGVDRLCYGAGAVVLVDYSSTTVPAVPVAPTVGGGGGNRGRKKF